MDRYLTMNTFLYYYKGRTLDSPSLRAQYLGETISDTTINNGGSTAYYNINPSWHTAQDIIEARNMNFSQGNIFKAAFTFNVGRHDATNYERELNKIAWFVQRELARINKKELI